MSQDPYRSAVISMPSAAQLGGQQPLPFVRFPFFPTAPWYSTNPNVGYQVRFYGATLLGSDTDFAVGTEAIRTVQFDIPVRLIAINGAAIDTAAAANATLTEGNMNLTYLFRAEYTTGDRLHTQARLASTVVGTQQNPGEIGGHGYNIDQGASLQLGITPIMAFAAAPLLTYRIDITLICLEMRAPRNFSVTGGQ